MKSSRQEDWSGLPFPPPGDLPDPGIEPWSPALAGGFLTTTPPIQLYIYIYTHIHIYMYVPFKVLFHYGLSQDILSYFIFNFLIEG